MTTPVKRNRRQFLSRLSTGVAAGFFINPARAVFSDSPNERLNIAAVGCTNRAGANIRGVESQNIVAISDIDSNLLAQGAERYPAARTYRDYR